MHMTAATNGALRILMACDVEPPISMSDMSRGLGLTLPTIAKTCNELMHAGYLNGRRGRGGGYRLARSAASIGVLDVIDLFEGNEALFPCRLHNGELCRILDVCRLRPACEAAHAAFRHELAALTLQDLNP